MRTLTSDERRAYGSRLREVFGIGEDEEDTELDAVERTWRWADENPDRAKVENKEGDEE